MIIRSNLLCIETSLNILTDLTIDEFILVSIACILFFLLLYFKNVWMLDEVNDYSLGYKTTFGNNCETSSKRC